MLSGSALRFYGITQPVFSKIGRRAARYGIGVRSRAGEADRDGVKIRWSYDPGAEVLQVECVRAPFWIDATAIDRRMSKEIERVLESKRAA